MELELVSTESPGTLRARVSDLGASLRGLWLETPGAPTWEAVWGYSGDGAKRGGQGDVLLPFPGRITGGCYEFDGRRHEMERNDKEGPNAIHGFARSRPWKIVSQEAASALFQTRLDGNELAAQGYPFTLDCALEYRLSGLECRIRAEVRNAGLAPAPVGIGFHPYFKVGLATVEQAILELPCASLIEFGPGFIPTGRVLPVEGTELDFLGERAIGAMRLNHCFARLLRDRDGIARARLRSPVDGRVVTLSMDRSLDYLVVYTGDALGAEARRAIAIEPMSCGTDAFNRPEWGLRRLAPGETMTVAYTITLTPSQKSASPYSRLPK